MSTCEWWVPAATSAVALVLYGLLLLTLYILLSRKIANHSWGKQESSSPEAQPQQPAPCSAAGKGVQGASSAGSSETSSETSEESGSSSACPQGSCSGENLNYTSLIFPGGGCGPGSPRDYENTRAGLDYVNVDPKSKTVNFWPCSSSVEYTQVKL
ncbi:regulator of hemoglobinization and erythroid cell expansion protein [Melanerpes formicivorus]|uniref:regulator of hemoglobinization and erythroid cell expansion protein n=1 Tax=Melanerpes formicivorus TaxID=211600 RepID=UPI00358E58A9